MRKLLEDKKEHSLVKLFLAVLFLKYQKKLELLY